VVDYINKLHFKPELIRILK